MLIFPLLLLIAAAPDAKTPDAVMADFSRFSKSIAQEISIVDYDGTVREGILTAATGDDVTVKFGSGAKTFSRAAVASADLLHDGTADGAIKGAVLGALMGALTVGFYDSGSQRAAAFVSHVAIYSGIGWMVDAGQTHRQPIYRVPAAEAAPAPTASLQLSLRF